MGTTGETAERGLGIGDFLRFVGAAAARRTLLREPRLITAAIGNSPQLVIDGF